MILIKNPFASTQKVAVSKRYIICLLFFVVFGCGSHDEMSQPPMNVTAANCQVLSFLEGVSMFSEDSNVYIIKGIALDKYKYGRNIKLVEDLKGNFPKNVKTFIAWGDGSPGITLERSDNLSIYENQDVLIMHLMLADTLKYELQSEYTWFEKPGDYCTFPCTKSVLKLSDGYVKGFITTPIEGADTWEQTMSWNDFQKELEKLLKSK